MTGKSEIPQPPAKKKSCTDGHSPAQCKVYSNLKFHSVDSQWQQGVCTTLSIPYKLPNRVSSGGPAIPLTCPNKVRKITGDGTSLFRSFLSIVAGVQTVYLEIHAAILRHMKENEACMVSCGLVSDRGVQDYKRRTRMNEDGRHIWHRCGNICHGPFDAC